MVEPGAAGTITRMGLVGNDCAVADTAGNTIKNTVRTHVLTNQCINPLLLTALKQ